MWIYYLRLTCKQWVSEWVQKSLVNTDLNAEVKICARSMQLHHCLRPLPCMLCVYTLLWLSILFNILFYFSFWDRVSLYWASWFQTSDLPACPNFLGIGIAYVSPDCHAPLLFYNLSSTFLFCLRPNSCIGEKLIYGWCMFTTVYPSWDSFQTWACFFVLY